MDGARFDALAKAVSRSGGGGRRQILAGLLGGTLASLLGGLAIAARPKKKRRGTRGKDAPDQRHRKTRPDHRDRRPAPGRPAGAVSAEKKKKKKKKKNKPVPTAGAGVSCPACGACHACVLDGDGCAPGCDPNCLARDLCQRANGEGDFRRLAAHLNTAGYRTTGEPEAYDVADADGPLRQSVAVQYQHRTRAAESAVLWYVAEAAGGGGSYAVLYRDNFPEHALVVDGGRVEPLALEENAAASRRRAEASGERVQAASLSDWTSKCAVCGVWGSIGFDHPCGPFFGVVCGVLKKSAVGAVLCAAVGKHVCEKATGDASEGLCKSLYCCGEPCEYQPNCCNGECCSGAQQCCGIEFGQLQGHCCAPDECCDGICKTCGGQCCNARECKTCIEGVCRGGCKPPATCARTPSGEHECQCPGPGYVRCPDPPGLGEVTCCRTRAPECEHCVGGACQPKCKAPRDCVGEVITTCECPVGSEECAETCCGGTLTCCAEVCVDLNFDVHHCGECGIGCESGETCCDGECCPAGLCRDGRCEAEPDRWAAKIEFQIAWDDQIGICETDTETLRQSATVIFRQTVDDPGSVLPFDVDARSGGDGQYNLSHESHRRRTCEGACSCEAQEWTWDQTGNVQRDFAAPGVFFADAAIHRWESEYDLVFGFSAAVPVEETHWAGACCDWPEESETRATTATVFFEPRGRMNLDGLPLPTGPLYTGSHRFDLAASDGEYRRTGHSTVTWTIGPESLVDDGDDGGGTS